MDEAFTLWCHFDHFMEKIPLNFIEIHPVAMVSELKKLNFPQIAIQMP